jgi:hypothetical protein
MTCRHFFKGLDPNYATETKHERIIEYASVDMNNIELEHLSKEPDFDRHDPN